MTEDTAARSLPLHRDASLGRSPFGPAAPTITAAVAYAVATLVWVLAGDVLPGGRWLAVHLFTLGVLTNLVLVFSEHFGRTLTRQPDQSIRWQPLAVNVAVLTVLVSLPAASTWGVAVGATGVTTVVFLSYLRLRSMRTRAVGARFLWIVRMYERAHGAFIHGAVLGLLMGTGVLSGGWYLSARTAHLHVNILGWGGLTLLATLVFFGPTLVRTRIVEGADTRAASALKHGATGLTVGVLLLLATGVGGTAGTALRWAAAAGLGVFAWAAAVTCWPVVVAARGAKPTAPRWSVIAVGVWFPVVAWVDVAVVATGRWWLLDALGLAVFLGVLGQAMVAVLTYLAPMLRERTFAGRDRLLARLAWGAEVRALTWNGATAIIVAGAAVRRPAMAVPARAGWVAIAVVLAWTVTAAVLRVRAERQSSPRPGHPAPTDP